MNRIARSAAAPLSALVSAFVLAAIAMLLAGVNPVDGFSALFAGSLGGYQAIAETLVQTTALLFPALGIAFAFRAGLLNIGAEGQLIAGGLAAGAVGAALNAPAPVAIGIILAAGCAGGAVWGAIAGWLRASFGASEIIVTLMLNFIAASLSGYLVSGPLKSPLAAGSETGPLPAQAWLPPLLPGTRLSIALLLALCIALALRLILMRTVFGYDLRALGEAPRAARRAGVNAGRVAFAALTASGAIAGLGGACIVSGVLHRFNTQLSPGYGYTAIAVALVGDLDPLWVCVAAFGFGILEAGGLAMQALGDVPKDSIHAIEGVIILLLSARRYITTRAGAPV